MNRHDETGGWIFTDDAHRWMDTLSGSSYRPGAIGLREGYGYAPGLYSIREHHTGLYPDDTKAATWPAPNWRHRLRGGT